MLKRKKRQKLIKVDFKIDTRVWLTANPKTGKPRSSPFIILREGKEVDNGRESTEPTESI